MIDDAITEAINAAYLAGFNASCEGHNGEYPFDDKGINPADDPAWCTRRDRNLAKINETQTRRGGDMAKRFLLFTSPTYYPYGGMDDCKGEFASLNDAVGHATSSNDYSATENMHILEIGNELIVWECDRTGQVLHAKPLAEYMIESD